MGKGSSIDIVPAILKQDCISKCFANADIEGYRFSLSQDQGSKYFFIVSDNDNKVVINRSMYLSPSIDKYSKKKEKVFKIEVIWSVFNNVRCVVPKKIEEDIDELEQKILNKC